MVIRRPRHPVHQPAELPSKLSPMLATLGARIPTAGTWIYEIKFDGYRLMARIGASPALITRGGHDWASKMPGLVTADLGLRNTWLDGEIVVLNAAGLPDFNALQNSFERRGGGRTNDIVYYVFDAPFLTALICAGSRSQNDALCSKSCSSRRRSPTPRAFD